MNHKPSSINLFSSAGSIAFITLIIFSVLFFKERIIIFDPAFHLFSIVRTGDFAIQNYRFGTFFTQCFPLIAVKAALPIKWVMIAYSVSFVILDAVLFGLLLWALRQPVFAILLLLNSLLMVNETFYWIQSEIKQGLSFLIFYLGFVQSILTHGHAAWHLPVHAFLLSLLAFIHPLIIFPFIFSWGLSWVREKEKARRLIILNSGIAFCLFYLGKVFFFRHSYDTIAMNKIENITNLFWECWKIPTNELFLRYLITDYYFLIGLLLGVVYFFLKRRQFVALFWFFLFFTGYLLLINSSYPDPANLRHFYLEHMYLPLGTMTLLALAHTGILNHINTSGSILILLFLAIRLTHIGTYHQYFTDKIAWQRQFLLAQPTDKIIYAEKDVLDVRKLIYTWGSAEEFWLLSTLELGETRSVGIFDNPESLRWAIEKSDRFITKMQIFDYAELPARYFHFNNTNLPYTIYAPSE